MDRMAAGTCVDLTGQLTDKVCLDFQLNVCPKSKCYSTVGVRKDLYPKDPHKVPITDFFGSLRPTEISLNQVNVTAVVDE